MDGNIIIGTELDTKSFDEEIRQTEEKLERLQSAYEKAMKPGKGFKTNEDALKRLRIQIEQTSNQLVNLREKQDKLNLASSYGGLSDKLNEIGNSTRNIITTTAKWGLALFGIRSIYGMLSSSASTLSQYNKQMGVDMQYIRFAIASTLQPIIEYIIKLVYKLLSLINAISQALFHVNIFANAGVDKFNKAGDALGGASKNAKELKKQLAGFDEMNVLQDQSSGGNVGGGGVSGMEMPSKDLSTDIPNLSEMISNLSNQWQSFDDEMKKSLYEMPFDVWTKAFGKWDLAVYGVVQAFHGLWNVITGVYEFFKGVIEIIYGLITSDTELVKKGFHDLWEGLKKILYGIFEFISGMTNAIKGIIKGIILTIIELIGSLVDKGVNLFNNFKDKVVSVWATIKDKIKSFITEIQNWLTSKFGAIGTAIGNVIGGSISGIINSILSFAEGRINGFLKSINNAISVVNKIPGVSISKISMVKFPRLAKGGILNRPGRGVPVGGAIAGEAGREFYMPLQDEQMLSLVGQAIGKYITINANITNTMNGRVISRELQRINNESDFAYNR